MTGLVLAAVAGVLGYAIGSVSSGYIVGKVYRNVDLRAVGSGSTGTTNALRTLGPGAAILVAVFDVLKGVLAVWVANRLVVEPEWHSLAVGLAVVGVIVGHCWPPFLQGRGGRGVATGFGAILLITWPSWPITIVAFVAAIAVTRMVSVGSLAAATTAVLGYAVVGALGIVPFDGVLLAFLAIASGVVIWRHRANIGRILAGREPRLGEGAAPRS